MKCKKIVFSLPYHLKVIYTNFLFYDKTNKVCLFCPHALVWKMASTSRCSARNRLTTKSATDSVWLDSNLRLAKRT